MKLVVDGINSEVLQSKIIQLVSFIEFSAGLASTRRTEEMLEQFFRAVVAGELSQLKTVHCHWEIHESLFCYLYSTRDSPELMSEAKVRLEEYRLTGKIDDGTNFDCDCDCDCDY